MNLAVYYPSSVWSAWNMSHGVVSVLRRMGHKVTDCPIKAGATSISRSAFPSLDDLGKADGILLLGPEHIGKYIRALYSEWETLHTRKVAWLHEPLHRVVNRQDLELCARNFSASPEDTECGYLPYGVDKEIFCLLGQEKRDIELGFIGLMYAKREAFLSKLPAEIRAKLKIGNCIAQDIDGPDIEASARLYARSLRRIKTLVVLPSLSRVVVTKVYEGWACGCKVAILHEDMTAEQIRQTVDNPQPSTGDYRLETRLETLLREVAA